MKVSTSAGIHITNAPIIAPTTNEKPPEPPKLPAYHSPANALPRSQKKMNNCLKGKAGRGGGAIRADNTVALEELKSVVARSPRVVRVTAEPALEENPESMAADILWIAVDS